MTQTARKTLDFAGLEDFEVASRSATGRPIDVLKKAIDQQTAFPSREAPGESQMNIKATSDVLARFRKMAKAERYKLGEFLEILMDAYDAK